MRCLTGARRRLDPQVVARQKDIPAAKITPALASNDHFEQPFDGLKARQPGSQIDGWAWRRVTSSSRGACGRLEGPGVPLEGR